MPKRIEEHTDWQLQDVAISAIQGQVAQIIARHGIDNTPLSQNMSVTEKFVIVLEALDELGHLLSDKEPVAMGLILRQVFKIAALSAMFGESLMES
jgi:hypothetical protein